MQAIQRGCVAAHLCRTLVPIVPQSDHLTWSLRLRLPGPSVSSGQHWPPMPCVNMLPVLHALTLPRIAAGNGLQRWQITYLHGTDSVYTVSVSCGRAACNRFLSSAAACGSTTSDLFRRAPTPHLSRSQ